MARHIAAAGIAALLIACTAAPQEAGPPRPSTTGQALAQIACPHRIAEANAWVNYMPGPGRSPRTLNVDVRLVEATDTAILLKSVASTGDTLILAPPFVSAAEDIQRMADALRRAIDNTATP